MFLAAILQFVFISVMSLVPYEPIQGLIKINITFYVLIFLLLAVLCFQVKDSFNLGLFRLSDQTKMQLFMSVKAFIIIFVFFQNVSSKEFLDLDLEQSHQDLSEKFTQAFAPFGFSTDYTIPYEFTCTVFGLLAAIISFCIVN